MDVHSRLKQLYAEKERIERIIRRLEAQQANAPSESRSDRGRRPQTMSPEEREAMSQRMKAYWAAGRQQQNGF